MKNIIIIFIISVLGEFTEKLLAQRLPDFQYTLYVEDSRGKKDSVILGYDRTVGYLSIDPIFGEIDIKDRPFDSVLEIRATEARNRFNIKFHSKKIVTQFEGDCSQIAVSSIITLLIRAKYYPIKLSWNRDLFGDLCRNKSIILNSEIYFSIEPPITSVTDSLYNLTYQNVKTNLIEGFTKRTPGGQPNPLFHYTFLSATNDGGSDTIWTYSSIFRGGTLVKTEDIKAKALTNYPNPCFESLNLEFPDYETGKIDIYDLAGRKLKILEVESINRLKIDVHDLNIGMYFLNFKTDNGKMYVSKFIKS